MNLHPGFHYHACLSSLLSRAGDCCSFLKTVPDSNRLPRYARNDATISVIAKERQRLRQSFKGYCKVDSFDAATNPNSLPRYVCGDESKSTFLAAYQPGPSLNKLSPDK